jgi:hypothetical protein
MPTDITSITMVKDCKVYFKEVEHVNTLPTELVNKFIKSFGDNEISIDEMYYNESKSTGINMRSFLEDFAEDIINHFT